MLRIELYNGGFPFGLAQTASNLIEAFRQYKINNSLDIFGRDFPYDRPHGINNYGIRHVHLLTADEALTFEKMKVPKYKRTSDNHLIYAVNPENPNHYLLICIVSPDAHNQVKNMSKMRDLMDICRVHFKIP